MREPLVPERLPPRNAPARREQFGGGVVVEFGGARFGLCRRRILGAGAGKSLGHWIVSKKDKNTICAKASKRSLHICSIRSRCQFGQKIYFAIDARRR